MRSRNGGPPGKLHPRSRDMAAIIDQLNVWAMAPDDGRRIEGLKRALNGYSKAVKAKKYAPMNRNFVMRTGYCNEPPPAIADSFQAHFGAPEDDTDNTDLPWKD